MPDWQKTLSECDWLTKEYTATTYNQLHNLKGFFDLVILDEAHAFLSAYPKPSQTWKKAKKFCANKPIIYLSATAYAQGTHLLYHQFALSDYSPWYKFRSFYEWYYNYAKRDKRGNFYKTYLSGRSVPDYTSVDHGRVLNAVNHLFVVKTRKELGFAQEPEDKLHYIDLLDTTKQAYNILITKKVLTFVSKSTEYTLVADTKIKLRYALHMLEGGTLKVDDNYITLRNCEKIHYILTTWGDCADTVIMYEYIEEGKKLRSVFENAIILQSTSYAEGTDLSDYEHLIIYSQNFSTAKHSQRRARQANKNRKIPINVHFLLVKDAVSDQVYNTVSTNKLNFIDKFFQRKKI